LNDKLGRWAIRSENTAGHDLRSEDVRESRVEDLLSLTAVYVIVHEICQGYLS